MVCLLNQKNRFEALDFATHICNVYHASDGGKDAVFSGVKLKEFAKFAGSKQVLVVLYII